MSRELKYKFLTVNSLWPAKRITLPLPVYVFVLKYRFECNFYTKYSTGVFTGLRSINRIPRDFLLVVVAGEKARQIFSVHGSASSL
jgi:hypothetical protein